MSQKKGKRIMNAQMNEKVMTNNEVTTSAPYFWYDHTKEKIIGKELNFKKSGIPGSDQDKELMARIAEHSNYTFRVIKPQKEKNSYKGLKLPLMYDYIDCFGSEEMMEKFNEMKKNGTRFPAIKSWFLDLFPKFNVEKAKKEIRECRLGLIKAKYKVTLTAPKNRKSTSKIAELPKASGQYQ